jgi:hypothetical protein
MKKDKKYNLNVFKIKKILNQVANHQIHSSVF